MSQRRKPSDPQELAQRRAERVAIDAEIARLKGQGATVTLDRSRRIVSAYRATPWRKLRDTNTITAAQAVAADKLVEDWATWKGKDGRPEHLPERVQATATTTAELITDRMLSAGRRVRRTLEQVGPMDAELLAALVHSAVEDDRPLPWRDVVRRVSGISQTVRQSQVVACALENLARVYSGQQKAPGFARGLDRVAVSASG